MEDKRFSLTNFFQTLCMIDVWSELSERLDGIKKYLVSMF